MYRPKFCAECGEKIIRLRWRPWTNRKFCDECSPRFLKEQIVQLATVTVVLLVVGMALGIVGRPTPPPLIIQRSQDARGLISQGQQSPGNAPASVVEEVYTCGARTKKGSPCSRRVHGPVRCWQHKGMPAMLPPDKLLIKDLAP